MRRASWASTRRRSSSRHSSTARAMAAGVISWKTMRLTGTVGDSTSERCHAIDSPSRSSSVARYSSSAFLRSFFKLATTDFFGDETTYKGLKPLSTSTPRRAHDSPLYAAGTSSAPRGRSRMWPTEDSTMKSGPSMPPIVRALAGDSTITSALPTAHPAGEQSER